MRIGEIILLLKRLAMEVMERNKSDKYTRMFPRTGKNPRPLINAKGLRGDTSKIWGDAKNFYGDASNIRGDVSNIRGDLTDIEGDVTGLKGHIRQLLEQYPDRLRRIE